MFAFSCRSYAATSFGGDARFAKGAANVIAKVFTSKKEQSGYTTV
jgi:hypothetical protein